MLTIGQMARICNISTKTLHHYEAIGLFMPAEIGQENQYRYYQPGQIDLLRKIVFFRSLGLGLEVIRELRESGAMADAAKINAILLEHVETLREEISTRQQLLNQVEARMQQFTIKGEIKMNFTIKTVEQFSVVGMEHNSQTSSESIPQMWQRFILRENEIQAKINPSFSYGICYGMEGEAIVYVAGFQSNHEPLPDGMVRVIIPTQKYAVFTHKGPLFEPGHDITDTFAEIHQTWPQYQLTRAAGVDFEFYDERFLGVDNELSEVDIYIPIE
ncbi:MerR family transcriptional regulator [Paenibacillus psychroresistens]|uniref:MerR family transcriptional regulator n=1 Tax=Paenibacillus psychroresistens TaxID=1778678 RepID=A0A6B8RF13_9BACL|nr:GyrI-like domain-containing protein [Paenibacillus psychroresistens]QGQ94145.1 MerR family transcriptional regulator [Paenibacillus psychroresistens]